MKLTSTSHLSEVTLLPVEFFLTTTARVHTTASCPKLLAELRRCPPARISELVHFPISPFVRPTWAGVRGHEEPKLGCPVEPRCIGGRKQMYLPVPLLPGNAACPSLPPSCISPCSEGEEMRQRNNRETLSRTSRTMMEEHHHRQYEASEQQCRKTEGHLGLWVRVDGVEACWEGIPVPLSLRASNDRTELEHAIREEGDSRLPDGLLIQLTLDSSAWIAFWCNNGRYRGIGRPSVPYKHTGTPIMDAHDSCSQGRRSPQTRSTEGLAPCNLCRRIKPVADGTIRSKHFPRRPAVCKHLGPVFLILILARDTGKGAAPENGFGMPHPCSACRLPISCNTATTWQLPVPEIQDMDRVFQYQFAIEKSVPASAAMFFSMESSWWLEFRRKGIHVKADES
ncbi:hypothetical protein QBC37DRAFT_481102 [Rhypophila decipiens]|uniref:Uncharacterized protein n=1 Tax=Rhypophila decipiens TaxID=261697 RepID=A0AAN6YGQ1_9PEZI|nr:hypothetical protein QBC37DRAFT_481102 [Rhypophila decipiens]